MKLDLLTNSTVVDDAIRFVTQKAAAGVLPVTTTANAKPKADFQDTVIEDEGQKQQPEEDDTTTGEKRQQESDDNNNNSTTTINQVF
jgi:hypothetical protein